MGAERVLAMGVEPELGMGVAPELATGRGPGRETGWLIRRNLARSSLSCSCSCTKLLRAGWKLASVTLIQKRVEQRQSKHAQT